VRAHAAIFPCRLSAGLIEWRISLLALLATLAGTPHAAQSEAVNAPSGSISLAEVAAAMDECLRGSSIQLNNYTTGGTSRYKPNGSSLDFSGCLAGANIKFSIKWLDRSFVFNALTARFYVNDIRLNYTKSAPVGEGLVSTFARAGTAGDLKVECLKSLGSCGPIRDRILDVKPDAVQVDVSFVPQVLDNTLSYGVSAVKSKFTVQANGIPQVAGITTLPGTATVEAYLKAQFEGAVGDMIFPDLQGRLRTGLMLPGPRAQFAARLKPRLAAHHIGAVTSLSLSCGIIKVSGPATPVVAPPPTVEVGYPQAGTFGELSCGCGTVVAGVSGRVGSWLDAVSLLCRAVGASGALGETTVSAAYGGSGGALVRAACPEGMVAGGLGGRMSDADQKLSGLTVVCYGWNASGRALDRSRRGLVVMNGSVGNSTVSPVDCPSGDMMTGLQVRSDRYVNWARLVCGLPNQ
jgi:hypothetical protein